MVDNAIAAGRLPRNCRTLVEIRVSPPSLHVRDRLREAQIDRIAFEKGVLSAQTWNQHLALDYDQEQMNVAMHGRGE